MRITRWPVHPRPIVGEELSSWLGRIAAVYESSVKDLLAHDLAHPALTEVELDLAPPETLLATLCERTGVAIPRIRSMTLKGWTRARVGRGKPGARLFTRYVKRYSVLLSPHRRDDKTLDQWRPWTTVQRFAPSLGCPGCLASDKIPYRRLHWRLTLIASCPAHGILLEPVLSPRAWIPQVLWKEERTFAPARLRALDKITLQALTSGQAKLPRVTLPTGQWLRLLRTILDELNTSSATAGVEYRVLKAVWDAVKLPVRVGARVAHAFEDLDFTRQVDFLHAAAEAIDLVSSHRLDVRGRDAHRLRAPPPPPRPIPAGPVLKPTEPWREALAAADTLLKAAHATPKGARELRALLLMGSTNPDRITRIDRFLTEEGIAIRK